MDEYPLTLRVPRSELVRGVFGFHYTSYLIEVDDCGRIYPRARRFTDFVWLHGELRRRDLACTLPELPPKRKVGKFEHSFVDRRRQMLENYLQALFRLPAVIQDDTIWAFLDADLATATVPRFLCRPSSHEATGNCLKQLERVAAWDSSFFRLCCPAVTANLVAAVRAETTEALPTQALHALQVRLTNRTRLCSVLSALLGQERARQELVESGLFDALLALLRRAFEDGETVEATSNTYLTNTLAKAHERVCLAVRSCLQALVEQSKGAALLHLCQQDGGLDGLRRVADAERLHAVAGSLLWHGMMHASVVLAVTGASTNGLPLLGQLLVSNDFKAKLLAGLCVGCVVRTATALDIQQCAHCLQALVSLPDALDAEEAAAAKRGAVAAMERMLAATAGAAPNADAPSAGLPAASDAAASPSGGPGTGEGGTEGGSAAVVQATAQRDTEFVALLRSLCGPQTLSRLHCLMCESGLDALTATVVAVFDHYSLHAETEEPKEPNWAHDLSPVIPQLERLVEELAPGVQQGSIPGGWGAADEAGAATAFSAARQRARVRAAAVLVRLRAAGVPDRRAAQETPSLDGCSGRALTLEVLTDAFGRVREEASQRVAMAWGHGTMLCEQVRARGLAGAPSLRETRLSEFSMQLKTLASHRDALGCDVEKVRSAGEDMVACLDQRGVKQGIFKMEVMELDRVIEEQGELVTRHEQKQALVREREELSRAAKAQVDMRQAEVREAQARARDVVARAREAENRTAALAAREAELAEVVSNAPANLERLQVRAAEVARKRASAREASEKLALEVERVERRAGNLRERGREADVALRSHAGVWPEVQELKAILNSELILTGEELGKLRQLEAQLQPSRPSRLRRTSQEEMTPPSTTSAETPTDSFASDADAPTWDGDAQAEKEFLDSPQFRSFTALYNQRGSLWLAEKRCVEDALARCQSASARLAAAQDEHDEQGRASLDEEEQLRKEMAVVDDFAGHAERHRRAVSEASAAHRRASEAQKEAAEASGAQLLAEGRLEQDVWHSHEAAALLASAREEADAETEGVLRVRSGLEKRCLDLEEQALGQLDAWQALRQQELRLQLLQARVASCIAEEANGRTSLRAEVRQLVEGLCELDMQLTVEERDGHPNGAGDAADGSQPPTTGAGTH